MGCSWRYGCMYISILALYQCVKQTNIIIFQTSQDPSSPLANMPSTSLPLASTTSNLSAQRNDPRDEWSWNDWGSLEEQPVSVN